MAIKRTDGCLTTIVALLDVTKLIIDVGRLLGRAVCSDNQAMYQGFDADTVRWNWTAYPPRQDTPVSGNFYAFGSAYPGGVNFVLCDGSVHMISYNIDIDTYRWLDNRWNGQPIDAGAF